MADKTIKLTEVTTSNFNECISLTRKSNRFVGDGEAVLAEAYIYRDDSVAYAICCEETIIGLVIVRILPTKEFPYSFTNLFIADDYQNQGYGKKAVKGILDLFKKEKKSDLVRIQVHKSNEVALKIYYSFGFVKKSEAKWDKDFLVLELKL